MKSIKTSCKNRHFLRFREYLTACTYRTPMPVNEMYIYRNGDSYPLCPRCKITVEREYQSFCDRCGQELDWRRYEGAKEVYIGWEGEKEE